MPRLSLPAAVVIVCTALPCASQAQNRAPAGDALAREGWTALQEKRFGVALEAFTGAARLAPREASLAYGAGVAAYMLGRNAEAAEWLQRAVGLDPRLADAALLLGNLHYREGRIAEAIATYEAALKHAPGRPELEQPLQTWRKEAQFQGRLLTSRGAHFAVLFEGPADDAFARRCVEMLEAAYTRIGSALRVYPPRPITVVLYTREQFRDITQSPDWAAGAYDGRIHVATRGALNSVADLESLLAHEFTHALVAGLAGPSVPAWLNEGLATVMEAEGAADADALLARSTARLKLSQLDRGFAARNAPSVALAYAQSAHAVRRMVQLRGMPAVTALLQDLGRGAAFNNAFHQRIAMRFEEFEAMILRD